MLWRAQQPVRMQRTALPRHVVVLGVISLLTAASTAMIYGLLPVFLVRVMGVTMASVGLIEGLAEGATSVAKIASGLASDWIGRRKPLVLLGYGLSAANKVLFPLATVAGVVLAARVIDRIGKGIRDAPRDAFLTDVTPAPIRGSGFGLRLAFYTVGFVLGPLAAMALMAASGDDFRLVFWIALIPAVVAIAIVLFGIKERRRVVGAGAPRLRLRPGELTRFTRAFWWAVGVASLLSLARFSYAFLVLKAHHIGVDPAYVPIMLVVMHLVYAMAAYPFGRLADRADRRLQLALGAARADRRGSRPRVGRTGSGSPHWAPRCGACRWRSPRACCPPRWPMRRPRRCAEPPSGSTSWPLDWRLSWRARRPAPCGCWPARPRRSASAGRSRRRRLSCCCFARPPRRRSVEDRL